VRGLRGKVGFGDRAGYRALRGDGALEGRGGDGRRLDGGGIRGWRVGRRVLAAVLSGGVTAGDSGICVSSWGGVEVHERASARYSRSIRGGRRASGQRLVGAPFFRRGGVGLDRCGHRSQRIQEPARYRGLRRCRLVSALSRCDRERCSAVVEVKRPRLLHRRRFRESMPRWGGRLATRPLAPAPAAVRAPRTCAGRGVERRRFTPLHLVRLVRERVARTRRGKTAELLLLHRRLLDGNRADAGVRPLRLAAAWRRARLASRRWLPWRRGRAGC
jgi:hypothetical protein